MDKPAFQQLQAQLVKRPPVESLRATGGCTLEIHRQVLKGRLRGQRADASTGHAEAFAADSCSDLLVFLLDMNNAPFVIDSVFISLSLIKGAYHACRGCFLFKCLIHNRSALQTSGYPAVPGYGSSSSQPGYCAGGSPTALITRKDFVFSSNSCITLH